MNKNVKRANELKAGLIIKNLEKRNMKGYLCDTAAEACELALKLIDEGMDENRSDGSKTVVSWGGSATLAKIGLKEKLGQMAAAEELTLIDPYKYDGEEGHQARLKALAADTFLMSTNAITLDGMLVNIDGKSNRVAGLVFGPKQVVIIAGSNKIVENEEVAVAKIKTDACPANAIRLNKKTPCTATGKCAECFISGQTICCNTVTTRFSTDPGRIKVILVNEVLGF